MRFLGAFAFFVAYLAVESCHIPGITKSNRKEKTSVEKAIFQSILAAILLLAAASLFGFEDRILIKLENRFYSDTSPTLGIANILFPRERAGCTCREIATNRATGIRINVTK